jgi:hypothetical protein
MSIEIRIVPEKCPNEFKISVGSRQMDWGLPVVVVGIHIGTVFE